MRKLGTNKVIKQTLNDRNEVLKSKTCLKSFRKSLRINIQTVNGTNKIQFHKLYNVSHDMKEENIETCHYFSREIYIYIYI